MDPVDGDSSYDISPIMNRLPSPPSHNPGSIGSSVMRKHTTTDAGYLQRDIDADLMTRAIYRRAARDLLHSNNAGAEGVFRPTMGEQHNIRLMYYTRNAQQQGDRIDAKNQNLFIKRQLAECEYNSIAGLNSEVAVAKSENFLKNIERYRDKQLKLISSDRGTSSTLDRMDNIRDIQSERRENIDTMFSEAVSIARDNGSYEDVDVSYQRHRGACQAGDNKNLYCSVHASGDGTTLYGGDSAIYDDGLATPAFRREFENIVLNTSSSPQIILRKFAGGVDGQQRCHGDSGRDCSVTKTGNSVGYRCSICERSSNPIDAIPSVSDPVPIAGTSNDTRSGKDYARTLMYSNCPVCREIMLRSTIRCTPNTC